ncbi:hypothetical protein ITP53_10815 [Nonomuraea sp. K274]|uniref:DUF4185 domain-containing protein n=1 Tax=Nonomuraea cypriaca TaxID=1187855 RepID=A0A931EW15_9ACTN|nr:hypothetical protein [Nonomuraea cypriaca]MBF8186229.1 hypothetical protein [Nonomuraea cypriaca]
MRLARTRTVLVVLLVGATGSLTAAPAFGAVAGRTAPTCDLIVADVEPDVRTQRDWERFGDRAVAGEWAGADGTYSAALPDGRIAWLFNDTFLGPVGPGRSIQPHDPVHNTIVTTRRGSDRPVTTVLGDGTAAGEPLPIVGPPGTDQPWYWNADGIVDEGRLYVFEAKQQAAGEGHFGFEWIGTDLAVLSLPDLKVERVVPTYDSADITWGVELLPVDGYIYIYGVRQLKEFPGTKEALVARAGEGELDGTWEFYTGDGWSSNEHDATAIAGDVGSSYGVSEVNEQYVMVTTDSFLGSAIYTLTASSPFSFAGVTRRQIYDTPEGQPEYDDTASGDIYTYNVAAHPVLSRKNTLAVSYNVNSTGIDDLFRDISNNRARFLEIRFKPQPPNCRAS